MTNELMTTNWPARLRLFMIAALPFFWAACLFLFMNTTSPLQSGPFGVLGVFVFFYLTITSTLYVASLAVYKAIAAIVSRPIGMRRKQLYYLVSVIGLGPVFIMALNTLGKLEAKEVILVFLLLIIGVFYVMRRHN